MSTTCAICLSSLEFDGRTFDLGALQCGHCFHVDCLQQLRASMGSAGAKLGLQCPTCRVPIKRAIRLLFSAHHAVADRGPDRAEATSGLAARQSQRRTPPAPPSSGQSLAALQGQLNGWTSERDELQGSIRDLQARLQALTDDNEAWQAASAGLDVTLGELSVRLDGLLQTRKAHDLASRTLKLSVHDLETMLQQSTTQVALLRRRNEGLQMELANTRAEYALSHLLAAIDSQGPDTLDGLLGKKERDLPLEYSLLQAYRRVHLLDRIAWTEDELSRLQLESLALSTRMESLAQTSVSPSLSSTSPSLSTPSLTSVAKAKENKDPLLRRGKPALTRPLLAAVRKPISTTTGSIIKLASTSDPSSQSVNGLGGVTKVTRMKNGKEIIFLDD